MAVLNSPSLLRSWGVERQKEERAKANSIKLWNAGMIIIYLMLLSYLNLYIFIFICQNDERCAKGENHSVSWNTV